MPKYTDKTASNSKINLGTRTFYSYTTHSKLVVIFKQPGETSVRLCETLLKHFENHCLHLVVLHSGIALQIHYV